jgi:hypothetical protein
MDLVVYFSPAISVCCFNDVPVDCWIAVGDGVRVYVVETRDDFGDVATIEDHVCSLLKITPIFWTDTTADVFITYLINWVSF